MKTQNKNLRVAVYCRTAVKSEDTVICIDFQKSSCLNFIRENCNWELADFYIDEGFSGNAAHTRPAFMRLIEDCKQGKIDVVVARLPSHISRNYQDFLNCTQILRNLGVKIDFVQDSIRNRNYNKGSGMMIY